MACAMARSMSFNQLSFWKRRLAMRDRSLCSVARVVPLPCSASRPFSGLSASDRFGPSKARYVSNASWLFLTGEYIASANTLAWPAVR